MYKKKVYQWNGMTVHQPACDERDLFGFSCLSIQREPKNLPKINTHAIFLKISCQGLPLLLMNTFRTWQEFPEEAGEVEVHVHWSHVINHQRYLFAEQVVSPTEQHLVENVQEWKQHHVLENFLEMEWKDSDSYLQAAAEVDLEGWSPPVTSESGLFLTAASFKHCLLISGSQREYHLHSSGVCGKMPVLSLGGSCHGDHYHHHAASDNMMIHPQSLQWTVAGLPTHMEYNKSIKYCFTDHRPVSSEAKWFRMILLFQHS